MHYFFNRSRRSSASFSKRKDFSWEGRNKNPYIREDKKSPRFSLIIRTILLLSILALTSFLLLSHSYFRINEVLISGTQRINTADLESAVRGIMDEKKFLLLRRDNFFMVNVEEIKDILLRRFPIKELVLTKTFPNSMSLALEEKISTLIYDNTRQYAYVDSGGSVIEILKNVEESEWLSVEAPQDISSNSQEATSSTLSVGGEAIPVPTQSGIQKTHKPKVKDIRSQFGDYPILVQQETEDLKKGDQKLPSEIAQSVISLFDLFNKKSATPIDYFELNVLREELTGRTGEGWYILFDSSRDLGAQFEILLSILDDSRIQDSILEYVDLRFEGRIYWK